MTIVHITFDFPDKIDNRKTVAVKNLVSSYEKLNNIVFSLNRTAVHLRKTNIIREDHGYTFYVLGLPFGIMLYFWMFIAYKRIFRILQQENIKPDLIHAHKLTFEGIIAYLLSRKLKVPYIITIRGNTDYKVFHFKRFYRNLYKKIVEKAGSVIFVAPWSIPVFESLLGKETLRNKYEVIPNIVNLRAVNNSGFEPQKRFISALRFKFYKVKNILKVISAFDLVFDKYPDFGLDIAGDGPNRDKIEEAINSCKNSKNFKLIGQIENSELVNLFSSYQGFVLTSYPETFGLVFIEALSAGIPVIYAKNTAIDGFFDDWNVGIGVDHRSIQELANAIEKIIVSNGEYRLNVKKMLAHGKLKQFTKVEVSGLYSKILSPYFIENLKVKA